MKKTAVISSTAIALLLLSGCSSESGEDEATESTTPSASETANTPEPSESETELDTDQIAADREAAYEGEVDLTAQAGEELWFGSDYGTIGKLTIPSEPHAPSEELRESVGADPVTYVAIQVDNREGFEDSKTPIVEAFDADGRAYEFHPISEAYSEWQATLPEESVEEYNVFVDAINGTTSNISIGQVAEVIMYSEEVDLPDEFTRVHVMAHGIMGGADAYPVRLLEGDTSFLDFEVPTN